MVDNLNIWRVERSRDPSTRTLDLPIYREGDIRQEVINTLYGTTREVAKRRTGLYRRTRLDENGEKTPCSCVNTTTTEADQDSPCPFCDGVGYYWDEVWFDYYKVITGIEAALSLRENFEDMGTLNVPRVSIYTHYDLAPVLVRGHTEDRIIELRLDSEGKVVRPYVRERIYRIGSAMDFRSDNGRLEYWKFTVHSDDTEGRGRASQI